MQFIIVAVDHSTGSVSLVSDAAPSRDGALDALTVALQSGDIAADAAFLLVDLDTATPVIVHAYAPAAPEVAEVPDVAASVEPAVVTPDAPVEPMSETSAEVEAVAEPEPASDGGEADAAPSLGEALKRAALSMSAEGIVPTPVLPVFDDGFGAPSVSDVFADMAALPEEPPVVTLGDVKPLIERESADEEIPEPAGLERGSGIWPWEAANADPAEVLVAADTNSTPDEPAEAVVDEVVAADDAPIPSPYEEAALETTDLITPTGEEYGVDFAPRPVVLGAYASEDTPSLDVPEEAESAPPEDAMADVVVTPDELSTSVEAEHVPAAQTFDESDPVFAVSPEAGVPAETAPTESEGMSYEPAAVNMEQYTCDDCVYVETCPKRGQDEPATCGLFQWKA